MDSISNQTVIDENELEDAKNKVLQKVGRNVLLFQQMEQTLKALVGTSNVSGYVSEIKSKQESKIESVKTQTMGQLVSQYVENNNPELNSDKVNEPENIKEPHISLSFRIETDLDSYTKRKVLINSLVEERNNLVHHFLPTCDFTSINSCKDALNRLDEQSNRIKTEINNFRTVLTSFNNMRKDIAHFYASEEFESYLKTSFMQQSPLTNILTNLAKNTARIGGWVVLSKAVSIINLEYPNELKNIKQNHGCKKLKDMMLKTELFEFSKEQTAKGNRVLYRLYQG